MIKISDEEKEAMKYFKIGKKLYHEGYYKEAIEPLKKAISIDNEFVWAYKILGNIYYEIEGYDSSIGYFLKELEINPNNFNVLYDLVNVYNVL